MSLVKNLFYKYEHFTIDIKEWEIPDSGITALWGPSGSGKTSIFKILLGLLPCPGLSWEFHNTNLAQIPIGERKLGVVFQSLELFPHLTAKENILFAAKARKIPIEKQIESLSLFTEELQMQSFLDRKVDLLSGGEKQRTALARALIGEPRFLFLDEPFSALDEELRQEARELVKKVIIKRQIPTLLITHDQRDIDQMAQQTFKLNNGKLELK